MSSSSSSTNDHSGNRSQGLCCGGWGRNGNWSGMNIAAMVLGFVFFWPIGLFILYWIITGRNVKELPQRVKEKWSGMTGRGTDRWHDSGHTDNVIFDEYQQTQFDRIHEIKEEIKERSRRFRDFRANARRRADEDEFNRFMSDTPGQMDS